MDQQPFDRAYKGFARFLGVDVIVMLQCLSPLRMPSKLNNSEKSTLVCN